MNFKSLFIPLAVMALTSLEAVAQQPYGGCWHPTDIYNWSPETDPDAKFNRSKVPLAKRFKEPELMKANDRQFYEGQVCNATILFNMCSMCPSQGANNFLGYQPTYWQYMDKLVYWAGSASEGIIIPPPAGSIDAAHAQGVKALGQIFFPPPAFGGTQTWVRQMMSKEGSHYVYARKLYEIAKYLGFDGWFINEEIGGASSDEWAAWMKDFYAAAEAGGHPEMEIQYYDARYTPDVKILSSHPNTSQFLEYGHVGDYRKYADKITYSDGSHPTANDIYSKIYAGIETVHSGLTGYYGSLDDAFKADGHVGSVDLFCPEEHSWKDYVKDLLGTSDDNGAKAYAAVKKVFENERAVWTNTAGNPSQTTSPWRGISGGVLERSAITSIPFESDMCVGVGKHRFVNGENKGTQDWYHSGVQSILPTWRWWIENSNGLKVSIDWDKAYNHGSSFKISGTLSSKALLRLYKTQIELTDNATAVVVYSGDVTAPTLRLSTKSSVIPDIDINATVSTKNGWNIATYDLSSLKGKTIYMVALGLNGTGNYDMNLGRLAIIPTGYKPVMVAINNPMLKANLTEDGGDARITWDYDWNEDFSHFDIYVTHNDGARKLVGQTRDEAFYIPELSRVGNENSAKIEIVAVAKDGSSANPVSLDAFYPIPGAPDVRFKPTKSYLKVGETTKIKAIATGSPTSWKWTLPSGLDLTAGSLTSDEITIKATKEGRFSIKLDVTNAIGTTTANSEVIDVLNSIDYNAVTNVLLNKTVVSFSGSTNNKETPGKIIDGETTPSSVSDKWCNVSPDNWAIFDCEGVYRFYGFKIYDCNSGPESGDNIRDYTIELSLDGKSWTTVVDEKNRSGDNIKSDYIAPLKARYVKLSPKVEGTLRIWEFEAYAADDIHMTISADPSDLRLDVGTTEEISVNCQFNGDEAGSDFSCSVKSGSSIVTIGRVTENYERTGFTIPVTATNQIGETVLTIRVTNNGAYRETKVKVIVDAPDGENILSGKEAELRHYVNNDFAFDAEYTKYETSRLTDGNRKEEALEYVNDYSSHTKDFWAVFYAPNDTEWNLAKIKVYIPDDNIGVNDNDKEGYVNKEIEIFIGEDFMSLESVKVFPNLTKTGELEYIFPKSRKAKCLAIACDVNPYFYPSLSEIEAYEQTISDIEDLSVEVSNWSDDVIAENVPSSSFADASVGGDGWVLYSSDAKEEGAVAGEDNIVVTKSGTRFHLAPYDEKNALCLGWAFSLKSLNFADPVASDKFHILALSSQGDTPLEVRVNYEDDTKSETAKYAVYNWETENEAAVSGVGRLSYHNDIAPDENRFFEKVPFCTLTEIIVPADPAKKATGLSVGFSDFDAVSNRVTILGVTRHGDSSGIHNSIIDSQQDRAIIGIYNIQGIRLEEPQIGLNIIKFADGSIQKVIIK